MGVTTVANHCRQMPSMPIPDDAEEVALQEADVVERKALAQRQLVSDVSKEAVLRDTAHIHSGLTFEAFTKVKQLEGQVRKYYASYADRVTGKEPFDSIIRQCGREPVVQGLLEQLALAKQSAAKGAADLKELKGHIAECAEQRAQQSKKLDELQIVPGEEQEYVDARVQQMIAYEKQLRESAPKEKSAAEELLDLVDLSDVARENYLGSAHTHRAGHVWPASGHFDQQARQAELQQLARTSRAFQREGGVRSAVRFMTDHPHNQLPGTSSSYMQHTRAVDRNMTEARMNHMHMLRENSCAEAEALPVVGSDIKSVFVTQSEMPTAYEFALSRRANAKAGMMMPPPAQFWTPLDLPVAAPVEAPQ